MNADEQNDHSGTCRQDAQSVVSLKEPAVAAFETEAQQTEPLTLQHQLNETRHPEVALHSCKYCAGIIIDMRKEKAGGLPRERGSQYTGFTSIQGAQAARDGCELFKSLAQGSYFVSLDSNADRPIHFDFSIKRHDRSMVRIQEHVNGRAGVRLLAEFELYSVPGKPLLWNFTQTSFFVYYNC